VAHPRRRSAARLRCADAGIDRWFRIAAVDAAGRRAWTNPIWIDELG
jgi:hypothetical protein